MRRPIIYRTQFFVASMELTIWNARQMSIMSREDFITDTGRVAAALRKERRGQFRARRYLGKGYKVASYFASFSDMARMFRLG